MFSWLFPNRPGQFKPPGQTKHENIMIRLIRIYFGNGKENIEQLVGSVKWWIRLLQTYSVESLQLYLMTSLNWGTGQILLKVWDNRTGPLLPLQVVTPQVVAEGSLLAAVLVLLVLLQSVLPPRVGRLENWEEVGSALVENKEGDDGREEERGSD